MIFVPYILTVIFTLSFCYYTKWQLIDEKGKSIKRGRWHSPGLVMRLSFCGLMYATMPWQDATLASTIMFPTFDIGVNIVSLDNVSPFYVGTTASFDKKIGMYKWPLYLIALVTAIILKINA